MSATIQRRPRPLAESSVLITGGTSGVGLASAIALAEAGVPRIALNGRNLERGAQALATARARVPAAQFEFIAGDCNLPDEARHVCASTVEAFGRIDTVLNSTVGPYGPKLLHNMALEEIPHIVTTQLMAQLLVSKLVLDQLRAQGDGGCIINIASDAGKLVTPGETVLGAVMAGIIMFSRTLAMEAKRDGIRVNVLTPSLITGTLTNAGVMNDEFGAKLFSKAAKMAQLGVVVPEDMAGLVVFLASPAAAKLTGQAISLNGGISAA